MSSGRPNWSTLLRRARRHPGRFKRAARIPRFRRGVVRGYTRRSGYYGRYTPGAGELKFLDVAVIDDTVASAGAIVTSLNLIPQGITENTRIGRKCTIRKIGWYMQWDLPAINGTGAAPSGDTVRYILYLDKQCNGAAAGITDILESADFQAFNNLANKGRFKTLLDRTVSLNYSASTGAGGAADNDYAAVVSTDEFHHKCNIPIEFNAAAGALTEIRSNNLGILLISSGQIMGLISNVRIRFSDR